MLHLGTDPSLQVQADRLFHPSRRVGNGLYLKKRKDGFPLTTGGNDPVEEDRCYHRGRLPLSTYKG